MPKSTNNYTVAYIIQSIIILAFALLAYMLSLRLFGYTLYDKIFHFFVGYVAGILYYYSDKKATPQMVVVAALFLSAAFELIYDIAFYDKLNDLVALWDLVTQTYRVTGEIMDFIGTFLGIVSGFYLADAEF